MINKCNKCNQPQDCCSCKKKSCGGCGGCGGCCAPAAYDCNFAINVSPYDPDTWLFTMCGATHRVKVPGHKCKDTTLSADYSTSTLVYDAEYHQDIIKGDQLGDVINLDDLRNVDIDKGLDGHCYELIYRKWAECGEGCRSAADKWENFNINTDGALRNGIKYVRGANEFGCPVYLDVPPRTGEYWWGMWRPVDGGNGLEFGYIQPEKRDQLPTDENGNAMVLSQDANGKPIYAPLMTSMCSNAFEFTARQADPTGRNFFVDNSITDIEFLVVPDDDPNWRAPSCGVMIVSYCVNPINQAAGLGEIDVTRMLSSETYTSALEARDSSHSTWQWTASKTDCSESATRFCIVPKGQTIKLHARDSGDNPGTSSSMMTRSGSWRIHAVRAMFIPLGL